MDWRAARKASLAVRKKDEGTMGCGQEVGLILLNKELTVKEVISRMVIGAEGLLGKMRVGKPHPACARRDSKPGGI